MLGGELVGAREALALGLVDELCDEAELLPRALALAADRAALPRQAYAHVKRQLRGDTIALAQASLEHGEDPLSAGWLGAETAQASARILDRDR